MPSDEVADAGARLKAAGSFRLETVSSGWSDEASEFRSTGVVDYANDRSEYRDESTGCREIMIGDVYYSEYAPQEGDLPAGKRWLKSRSEDYDTEALYEQSLEQNEQSLEQTSSNGELTFQSLLASRSRLPDPAAHDYLDVSCARPRASLSLSARRTSAESRPPAITRRSGANLGPTYT